MTDLDPGLLRAAFARYMTGVTVVTSRNARDEPGVVYAIYDERRNTRRLVFRAHLRAPAAGLVAKPIVGLSALTVSDPAVHAVLSRFETEFRNQSFGLYVGDHCRGDVLPGARG